MTFLLYLAAILLGGIGIAHSYLGERFILQRLFRRGGLPVLLGGTKFTQNTLRFAWHLTTVAWWGFAVLLVLLAHPPVRPETLGQVIAGVFAIHFLVALIASRGRHLAWIVFLLITGLTAFATR